MAKKINPKDLEKLLPTTTATTAGRKSSRVRIAQGAQESGFQFTLPMPFQPEFADPSRVQWPIDRLQQNRYWRLYYKTDPVIGTIIDLFSEIIASEFTLTGEGVDGTIKDTYETMISTTQIVSLFSYFIREFLVLGEVIPHLVFDKDKKIWTNLIFHNPDQIKVIDSPFIALDPIVEFTPDEALRALARSKHPVIQKVFSKLPPEVQGAITSGQNLPLDTSLNVTFIARKIHPYDIRGTGVLTRIFRILMYEDAIMNASIATARRHAGPLKVAKLGDKDLKWVPETEYQDKVLNLLTLAEQDPHAFLVMPWFVNFESFGTTDRMMSIKNEWDVIERIKLTAMGVSQGFLHGEATYASMKGNMQTLLMKLRGVRTFFENVWWYPKFFAPIAEMNEFIKRPPAEVQHRLRFRRSRAELLKENRFAIPKIQWQRSLDPKVDFELLDAYEQLVSRLDFPVSKSTAYAAAGLDFEEETVNILNEKKKERELEVSMGVPLGEGEEGKGAPAGGGGVGLEEIPAGEEATPAEEAPEGEASPEGASKQSLKKTAHGMEQDDFEDLVSFIETGKASSFWKGILKKGETAEEFSKKFDWQRVEDFLDDEGYTAKQIQALRSALLEKELIEPVREDILEKVVGTLDENSSDSDLNRIADLMIKSKVLEKKRKQNDDESFLVGAGNKKHM